MTGPVPQYRVYRCPVHGLIESPTWHEDEIPEDSAWYCPINLTGKPEAMHEGITDEVCGKDVEGPFTVAFTWTGTGSDDDFTPPVRKIEGGNSG